MLTNLTPRERAGAILSGRKMQMLEQAGIAVVDKTRLEALEEVAKRASTFVHRWSLDKTRHMYTRDEETAHKKKCAQWERELLAAVNGLEVTIDGQATDATDAASEA